jgi:hypothetical protein
MSVAGYILAFSDEDYDAVLPAEGDTAPARALYKSLDAALKALDIWAKSFDRFRPALYSQAYPYENTTLAAEIARTGRGLYGWAELEDEDGDVARYGLCVVALKA